MKERGVLDHTIVQGVFVGPARSGKNTLMERLLGQTPPSVSPSTGVAENVVQVKVIQKCATVAAKIEELFIWSEMDYDDEAIKLMLLSIGLHKEAMEAHEAEEDEAQFTNDKPPLDEIHENNIEPLVKLTEVKFKTDNPQVADAQLEYPSTVQPSSTEQYASTQLPDATVPPVEILKEALRNKGREALKQHFEKTWSLYLTNTGGQIEFQEVLPLVVSGPSIFFFVFRLDRDLKEYYTIEYELSDGGKSYPYTSTLSTIDGIMQTLASISAMGTFVYSGLQRREKPLRPKVFFVGTHKDLLDSKSADSHINNVDLKLKEVISSTAYYKDLVEYASKSHLIFAVNNFSQSDSDFRSIRSAVQRVVTRNEFQMTSPVNWFIFSLAIRKLEERIITYDLCLKIARECGLADDKLDEALNFIHSKMGLIRYFPYEPIRNLVVIDPQFLFDKVTELIVSTFTFEKVGQHEMEQFKQTGIFSLDKLEELSGVQTYCNKLMSTFQFGKLLERLRIAAPLKVANENKYFLPCVLSHACESNYSYDTPVPALLISFKCGYIPKGVAGALIQYIMANEMKSQLEWELRTDRIFKNEVSFYVGPYDTVILRTFPKHFEITFIPNPKFSNDKRQHHDCHIHKICEAVLKAVDKGVKQILQDLNYIETQHYFTFSCDVCKDGHPVQLKLYKGTLCSLQCNIKREVLELPKNISYWKPAFQAVFEDAIPPEKSETLGNNKLLIQVLVCY